MPREELSVEVDGPNFETEVDDGVRTFETESSEGGTASSAREGGPWVGKLGRRVRASMHSIPDNQVRARFLAYKYVRGCLRCVCLQDG